MDCGDVKEEASGTTGRSPSDTTSECLNKDKGQRDQRGQPANKISPFHNSPIGEGFKAAGSTARGYGPSHALLLGPLGRRQTFPPVKEEPASGCLLPVEGNKAARVLPPVRKSSITDPHKSRQTSSEKRTHKSAERAVVTSKPHSAVKRKKRKMGMYNLVPKKKTRVLKNDKKEEPLAVEESSTVPTAEGGQDEPARALSPGKPSAAGPQMGRDEANSIEYTELALDSLDLKAQEEFLSPPLSEDADGADTDLAEELPLCCCRMETPPSGDGPSAFEQTCMAMESSDGMVSRCQRWVLKQEMMRPSNTVHLLVLCEDHRAGMVKHQCCPGCGLFCRAGTFLECRPYGSISHRFHHGCSSVLKDRRFCPHCGENASGAHEVTVAAARPDPASPMPRADHPRMSPPAMPAAGEPGPSLPATTTSAAAPPVLRAKKSSEPWRTRAAAPDVLKADSLSGGNGRRKESLESILCALDDANLKPQKLKYPATELYVSAQQGELQHVIHLLVEGMHPNMRMDDDHQRTPLHAAASGGHHEICHMLIQAGANLELFDDKLKTPLMCAVENLHVDTVQYLLKAGAALGQKDIRGSTCLHMAAKLGHYDIVHHLLTKGSKYINCQDDGGWTPVTWAIENKHRAVVQQLLAKGTDINIRDKEENVCLHWAALSGCEDISQALLDARGDLHAANVHGDSPLHVAARENHLECVMLFLSRGASVSLRNRDGETALDCCLYGSKVWSALSTNKRLTDARRERDCHGETLLCRDISRGYESVAITCVNGVDGEPCPADFKYVPDSCVTSPLNMDKDITHLQHCTCAEDCLSSTCMCGHLNLRCCYDNDGRLPLDFCQREPPVVFECNYACTCWRTCKNRVVQNGLRVRLQLYRTQEMGWGVRALQDIPQGTFVCEYVGEIIKDAEADQRQNDSFLFTLDNKVGDVYCIDARLFGNVGRFINHQCEPNLLAVRVFTTHQDLRFPRIAFFTGRAVRAGEQIGFDYGDHYWRIKSKFFSCRCGAQTCRHAAPPPSGAAPRGRASETAARRAPVDGCNIDG